MKITRPPGKGYFQGMATVLDTTPSDFWFLNSTDSHGPETSQQVPLPAGTLTKLKVQVSLNTIPNAMLIVVRLNGADTDLNVTVPMYGFGTYAVAAGVAVAENGLVCVNVRLTAGYGDYAMIRWLVEFQPS